MVNEGTLRKPQGPCYAFAIFLQLKEVHLFPVKSHHVTANSEYFKCNMKKLKMSAVNESAPIVLWWKVSLKRDENIKPLLLYTFSMQFQT